MNDYVLSDIEREELRVAKAQREGIAYGRKEGAINELKIIIKRNSNFKYSRLDMIEFCEKRLNKLQSGETK